MEHNPDDDELDGELPPLPPGLTEAAEELLARAARMRVSDREGADTSRLLAVLERLGGLSCLCVEEAGLFASMADEPRDEGERVWAAERDQSFVRRCADELALIAAEAVEFTVALWVNLCAEWGSAPRAQRGVIDEVRDELLAELGSAAPRTPAASSRAPSKREVADELFLRLRFAAIHCAEAVYELRHARLPSTAGSTMLDLAADLLVAGEEIARAAGHTEWPEIADDG